MDENRSRNEGEWWCSATVITSCQHCLLLGSTAEVGKSAVIYKGMAAQYLQRKSCISKGNSPAQHLGPVTLPIQVLTNCFSEMLPLAR